MKDRKPVIKHLRFQVLDYYNPVAGCHLAHLKVWRGDDKSGISWDQLQAIKNEAIGEDANCVEAYPAQDDTINEANIRHLWQLPYDSDLSSLGISISRNRHNR